MTKLNGVDVSDLSKINGLEISRETLAVGTILFYDGSGINSAGTRTEEIGQRGGDTIALSGWWVANGNSSTPDFIDQFIRAEATSSDVASGSNNSIDVTHTHTIPSVVAHTHGLNSRSHTHTFPSSGSIWDDGLSKNQAGSGNAYSGLTHTSSSAGSHTHSIGSTDSNHTHTMSGSAGSSGTNANIPYHYTVIVIIKMS